MLLDAGDLIFVKLSAKPDFMIIAVIFVLCMQFFLGSVLLAGAIAVLRGGLRAQRCCCVSERGAAQHASKRRPLSQDAVIMRQACHSRT